PVPMDFVGIEDRFAESGDYEKLLEKYGLSVQNIVKKAEGVIKKKR
ncbi:MAG: 1-deoxy-D-xylulose-5-phosphate synthase, partial [Clostridiales bacterium]|nr:1-deoxy-D-xylulose-5-phosphate synthase [Clostridiales bacterium]